MKRDGKPPAPPKRLRRGAIALGVIGVGWIAGHFVFCNVTLRFHNDTARTLEDFELRIDGDVIGLGDIVPGTSVEYAFHPAGEPALSYQYRVVGVVIRDEHPAYVDHGDSGWSELRFVGDGTEWKNAGTINGHCNFPAWFHLPWP